MRLIGQWKMSLFPGIDEKTGKMVNFPCDFSCGFPGSIIEPCGKHPPHKE
ncbi:hypothetical protein LEP1GSC202_3310 [Leptospira yanagawae serovar Saopaulo str. Sao Paulo = ATCC 700523]|uniref:Uncharacterized protein n=1 Tax=Leptospira yanagawae serovar Saopaulo str. Sao Paulo = ATCC 700523 TaxID=1249483 RepID=A0A5E8HBQ3_9LEPT|nr:hypothetical protein LEP1GSC202_3310 [Leptospira yanagawae serovar Saopaulo str. Sao Paulo = ATCC 700523]